MIISLDMYQTLFAAVCVLMLGRFLKARIGFLEKFCIPAPVIGGVLFAVFTCLCYVTGIAEFEFDDILKEVCMVFFFTSVGFQANLKVLKSGGKSLILFLGLVVALILCQNFLAVGLADLLGISPLIGLCTGSIPMVGGHGTAGAFGPVLEDFGVAGATTLCTAAATYGLIAGSVMGGPTGRLLDHIFGVHDNETSMFGRRMSKAEERELKGQMGMIGAMGAVASAAMKGGQLSEQEKARFVENINLANDAQTGGMALYSRRADEAFAKVQ